ncbi:MAG: hypothetical protein M3088_03780, partial [Actinomycetota bacterium]|nr:hypothetical protein [Actinomycetota bacterium]
MLAVAATALLATGGGAVIASCGSDEDKGAVNVGQAAKATAAKGTARMTMQMRMSGMGLPEPIDLKARGVTALGEPRADLSMDLGPVLELVGAPAGGGRSLEMLVDGADLYVRPPRIEGLTIPGGKRWLALDLRALAEAAGLPAEGVGALFNIDPASQLRALRAAKGLEEVGKEEIDGAQTTHLKGTYRLSDVIAALPERERAEARRALDALERIGGQETGVNQPVPADLWIDEDGVTRRMRATSKLPAQGGAPAGSVAVTYALSDFGAKLDTRAPPPDERYDATEALSRA